MPSKHEILLVAASTCAAYSVILCLMLIMRRRRRARAENARAFKVLLKNRCGPFRFSRHNIKMVIVVRTDLKMGKGKIAAQVGHASTLGIVSSFDRRPELLYQWMHEGQKKVVLKCASEEELYDIQRAARSAGLLAHVIQDAGRTQVEAKTATCLGIGPDRDDLFDGITSHLRLL